MHHEHGVLKRDHCRIFYDLQRLFEITSKNVRTDSISEEAWWRVKDPNVLYVQEVETSEKEEMVVESSANSSNEETDFDRAITLGSDGNELIRHTDILTYYSFNRRIKPKLGRHSRDPHASTVLRHSAKIAEHAAL